MMEIWYDSKWFHNVVNFQCLEQSTHGRGGGGFSYSKVTWGCAARKGMLFRISRLAKGILVGNFS